MDANTYYCFSASAFNTPVDDVAGQQGFKISEPTVAERPKTQTNIKCYKSRVAPVTGLTCDATANQNQIGCSATFNQASTGNAGTVTFELQAVQNVGEYFA